MFSCFSALLPPVNRVHPRPRSPPPPPPASGNSASAKPPSPLPLSSKLAEESENGKDVKVSKNSVFYNDAQLYINVDPVSSIIPQQTSTPKTGTVNVALMLPTESNISIGFPNAQKIWFCQRCPPVKREFFIPTIANFMLM